MTDKIEPVFLRRNFNDSEVVELEKKKEEKLYKHIDFLVDNGYISEDEGNRRVLKITNGEEFRYPTFFVEIH
jgi:polyhydroxyalkanoate synthesis regulator phasin